MLLEKKDISAEWIDINDAMPSRDMKVKWLCIDGVEDVGFFYKEKETFATFDLRSTKEITHWQRFKEFKEICKI